MKTQTGSPRRPGLDDPRYRHNRELLKRIGAHICGWCQQPIDMQLHYPHPLSWSCDHRIPRSQLHPADPRHWHLDFLLEAHRRCNSSRGAKPLQAEQRPVDLELSIDW